jgi:hypothetical protein
MMGDPPAWGLGEMLTTPHNKNVPCYGTFHKASVRCETWSLTLREEYRLRAFENRLLRKIFERKREKARGECRRLHNVELYDLYSSSNTIRATK